MNRFFFCVFCLSGFLLIPDLCYAWGPAMHINLASVTLDNLQALPSHLQSLLGAYRWDYIYGCISADIISGKKFTEYVKHCHNWHIGMKVLENARSGSQKAFAYGYLSHLAADVIAHNYFVPNQIISSFNTRTLKHTYWEVRYDTFVDKSVWDIATTVAKEMHTDNDPLLKATLDKTLFSFKTNKRIFNGMLMVGRLKRWQKAMDIISSRSQWSLSAKDVENYKKLSIDAIFAFLIDGKQAICYKADPAGRKSLQTAKEIRKELRELKKRRIIEPKDYPSIFEKLRPSFKEATIKDFGHLDLKKILA